MSDRNSPSPIETIYFHEAEDQDGFIIREGKEVVNIFPSRSSQRAHSSKLKFRNFVDYQWDFDHGNGRLISTHYSGKFIAYVVKVSGVGAIRIVDLETNERGLMKGHKGLIKDLEFMHKADQLVVGYVDEMGSVFIHKVNKDPTTNKLTTIPLIQINLPENSAPCKTDLRRFMWCKYVPDDNAEPGSARDCAYHFAVCQNHVVHVSNLIQLTQKFGEGQHSLTEFKGFYMTVDAHSDTVMDASFAPDGTALATASRDGTVKFFQVYMIGNESPRCLYSWSPHDGRAVGKIFFLDDHNIKASSDSQYWKYMLTAVDNMSEIKLWTCKTWQCLQHIRFDSPSPTHLRMDMDVTAHYLVMGDVYRKVMFILHLLHDDESARFNWVSEFSLPNSMLSFNVNLARTAKENDVPRHLTDFGNQPHTMVEVYFVQSKSLQQGTVIFPTPQNIPQVNGHNRISFNEEVVIKDLRTTKESISVEDSGAEEDENTTTEDLTQMQAARSALILGKKSRSPSPARHSQLPAKVEKMTEELSSLIGLPIGGLAGNRRRSPSAARSPEPLSMFTSPKPDARNLGSPASPSILKGTHLLGEGAKTSSSSSPSREVEEIMSPKATNELVGRRSATSPSMEMRTTPLDGDFSQEENDQDSPSDVKDLLLSSNGYSTYMVPNTHHGVTMTEEVPLPMPQIVDHIQGIMELLKMQATEMKDLRREITALNSTHIQPTRKDDERSLEKYISRNQSQIARIEESVKTLEILERQRIPQNNNPIPANIADVLATSIGHVVKTEIDATVIPSLIKSFDPTRLHVAHEVEKIATTADERMRQEIRQFVQTEVFRNTVTSEIKSAVKPLFEAVLLESCKNNLIPMFEKAMQSTLMQINDTFTKGTRDYLDRLQASVEMLKSVNQEKAEVTLNNQFLSMQDNLTSTMQVEMESQMLRVIQSLQGGVVKQLEDTISKEIGRLFREQQKFFESSVVPRSSTPALSVCSEQFGPDPVQLQKQMLAMATAGDISGAFTMATSTGNLNLLMYLCNKISPSKVFTRDLPLQTHLSMIQQMSTELVGHTEVKLNYLQAAISALDTSDRRVQQSIARIVPIFQGSVKKYFAVHPESKYANNIKLMEMALLGIGGIARTQGSAASNESSQNPALPFYAFGGTLKHET